jgi:putative SOS response-associated peptidase YedK
MYGRFPLRSSPKAIAEVFGLIVDPHFEQHYNVATSQSVTFVC